MKSAWLRPEDICAMLNDGPGSQVLEPPSAASPWVAELLQQARAFGQKLDAASRLQPADRQQVGRLDLNSTS